MMPKTVQWFLSEMFPAHQCHLDPRSGTCKAAREKEEEEEEEEEEKDSKGWGGEAEFKG